MLKRKVLAVLLSFCLVFGVLTGAAVAAVQTLALEHPVAVTVPADDSGYVQGEVSFTFTAPKSGSYAFAVSYDQDLEQFQEVYMYAETGAGVAMDFDQVIFQAEAGEVCQLTAEYGGFYDTDVEYTFQVAVCQPLESVKLEYDSNVGYVGESMYMSLSYQPVFHVTEQVAYSTTDPNVVQIAYYDETWLELKLLDVGTATVTVTTESGMTDSVEISVVDSVTLDMGGPAAVTVPGDGGYVMFSFTPAEAGCYIISCDNAEADFWLEAYDYYYDYANDAYIYQLEAGVTYSGYVYNWGEESFACKLSVESTDVQIPVGMEVTKLPDNTTYLRDTLELLLLPNQVMVGMEMEVTWADGSKTIWKFNEDGPYLGYSSISWAIEEEALVLTCGELSASCPVTVLDVSIESVGVDTTPIQIPAESKYYDEDLEMWLYPCLEAQDREVLIRFSDGSSVTAMPGDMVYGLGILCVESQVLEPWVMGGENLVVYSYGDAYEVVNVEIVEGPEESTEPSTDPTTRPTEGTESSESTESSDSTEETEPTGGNSEVEINPPTGDGVLPVALMLLSVLAAAALVSGRKLY